MLEEKRRSNATSVKQTSTIKLPVNNNGGIAEFSDILNELQRRFNVERNVKNNLYSFILSNGLGKELVKFEQGRDMERHNAQAECLDYLFTSQNSPLNK